MTMPPALRDATDRLTDWLLEDALPIWWEVAADHKHGGFHDRINLDGTVAEAPRRLRVQARQAFVYAMAPRFGWTGPAKAACRHGVEAVLAARCEDGLYRPRPDAVAPLDGMGLLYDQAFVLLALANDKIAFGENGQDAPALALLDRIRAFAHPLGGFGEAPGLAEPLFANPNMHLFEAFQAWTRASADPLWRDLADGQATLLRRRLIDPATGVLGESFGRDWTAPAHPDERRVWPGHCYEWAFLLLDWAGDDAASRAAGIRLVDVSERTGVDADGISIFAQDAALNVVDPGARLWSQTERLRVCARIAALTGDGAYWDAALQACQALDAFLDVPTPGLWRDWREPDGSFREEAAPGSSLYHIVGAIAELARIAGT
jgi:mannose-6-phosphate isomerase